MIIKIIKEGGKEAMVKKELKKFVVLLLVLGMMLSGTQTVWATEVTNSNENNKTPVVAAKIETETETEQKNGWFENEKGEKSYYIDDKPVVGRKTIKAEDGKAYEYYFDKNGVMQTGLQKIEDNNGETQVYCYDVDGKKIFGEYKCILNDKKWHYFDVKTGIMVTGFATIPVKSGGTKRVYYDNSGAMVYGEYKCNDNKWHYFNTASGKMVTGFATIPIKSGGKKKVYYDNNGAMVYGWVSTGGTNYYCDLKSGALKYTFKKQNGYYLAYNNRGELVKDLRSDFGNQSSYVIKVNTSTNTITVYAKFKDGTYTMPLVAFICSCGAPSTPTPLGTYYTSDRWRWLRMMGPSWGQWVTQIKGDYLFHSVYYNSKNNNNNLSVKAYNKLGTACSHGCVRLKAGDAKWIYDNCKLQTKIVIYKGASSTDPLGKPTAYKLSSSHTWDPTDPNMAYKCKQHGCH